MEKLSGMQLFNRIEKVQNSIKWYSEKENPSAEDFSEIDRLKIELNNLEKLGIDVKPPTEPIPENPDMKLDNHTVRKFALLVLDDQNGISFEAMELLSTILVETNNEDILSNTVVTDDETRVFIHEDYAEEELAKL